MLEQRVGPDSSGDYTQNPHNADSHLYEISYIFCETKHRVSLEEGHKTLHGSMCSGLDYKKNSLTSNSLSSHTMEGTHHVVAF